MIKEIDNKTKISDLEDGQYMIRRANGTKRIFTVNNSGSMCDQSFKEECCASNIIDKFKKTGMITHIAKIRGQYADVSEVPDLHDGLVMVQHANEEFKKLPSEIRNRFRNSKELIKFMDDPKNHPEAVKLGLMSGVEKPDVPVMDGGKHVSTKDVGSNKDNSESGKASKAPDTES